MGKDERTSLLIGEENISKLKTKRILLFGLGGVGGSCFEMLLRLGVKEIGVVDGDVFEESNLNRQILSTRSVLKEKKVSVAIKRGFDIDPDIVITPYDFFYNSLTREGIPFSSYDIVLDCIDTISAKIDIAQLCFERGIKLISCLATGKKLDPTQIRVGDLFETSNDPIAKVLRRELRKRNVTSLKVVYSLEHGEKKKGQSEIPSAAFVPNAAGIAVAYQCYKELLGV